MRDFPGLARASTLAFLVVLPALAEELTEAGEGPSAKRVSGALVIHGGGQVPDQVVDRFVQLAGGDSARIVVIPTASESADTPEAEHSLDLWKARRAASVVLFHTRSREKANDPAFVEPLRGATGVWLGGGDQSKLTEAYLDTAVERELEALLARGGVIGGTSAGAAVMTRVMIRGGESKADLGIGFDFVRGAVVDQHFLARNRANRLLGVLTSHPALVGLGIDEQTALVVQGGKGTVLGKSYVVLFPPAAQGQPRAMEILKSGGTVDLEVLTGAPEKNGEKSSGKSSSPAGRGK